METITSIYTQITVETNKGTHTRDIEADSLAELRLRCADSIDDIADALEG